MENLELIREQLASCGQEHLLRYYEELDEKAQALLLERLSAIDFERLDEAIKQYVLSEPRIDLGEPQPAEVIPARPADATLQAQRSEAVTRGEQLVAAGKVAAFVVAGGQGTRLGLESPKGCLEATPVVRKPLFQVFAEQIRAAAERAGVTIPWYVMTSAANDVATRAFFRQHNFFGLNSEDVFFLVQGSMPAIGFDGKVLLAEKGKPATSPDGHGGCLMALRKSGALDDMARRGIEYISYFQIDNPLVKCIDPLFIGLHELKGAEMSAKCLAKRDPAEKLGNFCRIDGKTMIIEYSDMPEELAMVCAEDGRLKFSAGSIAIHIISRSFVQRLTDGGRCSLPLHRAEKAVPYVDDSGEVVKPDAPNAIKLEMFVFDALPLANQTVILEVDRTEEFSPIKNESGSDSLATSLHDQIRRSAGWLEEAGIVVPRDADGQVAVAVEISPLFADNPAVLAAKIQKDLDLAAGGSLYLGSRGQTGGLK